VEVTEDVPYTSERAVDVYAPAEGSGWPVAVHFHGGLYSPEENEPLARAVAEQGVVVFVPGWRSLGPDEGSQDTICALAFAAERAEEYGGDVARVVPSGYSSGGFTALTHAFMGDDPPLPVTDCEVDPAIDLPEAVVVGGAPVFAAQWARDGFFDTNPKWASLTPEQIDAFDPYLAIGQNPDLRERLVVGEDDIGGQPDVMFPIAESNREYHAALIGADYDAELTEVPGGHLEPITPGTESWSTYVDTIVTTARGE
jgi:acetyl esterase/lipase